MKEKKTGFFRKLWKEERGASHIVEIVVVILVVLALVAILSPALGKLVQGTADEVGGYTPDVGTTQSSGDGD